MVASVLAIQNGEAPQTLNYETPDPRCPVNVIHGEAMPLDKPTAVLVNHNHGGQAAALVITTVATIYPAVAASKLRPVEGIRHE